MNKRQDIVEEKALDYVDLEKRQGLLNIKKDHDYISWQPTKQDIFFLPVLQGCTRATFFSSQPRSDSNSWYRILNQICSLKKVGHMSISAMTDEGVGVRNEDIKFSEPIVSPNSGGYQAQRT